MVITVEPGCYFNEFTMRPALADASMAHLLVPERIEHFMVRCGWAGGYVRRSASMPDCRLFFKTQKNDFGGHQVLGLAMVLYDRLALCWIQSV